MACARRTAEILRTLLTQQKHADAAALIDDVRRVGCKMQRSNPVELSIGNMVRRVLHIVREEAREEALQDAGDRNDGAAETSAHHRMDASPAGDTTASALASLSSNAAVASYRALSLSNLLDVGIADLGEIALQQQGDPHQLQQQQQQQQQAQTQPAQQDQHEAEVATVSEAESWASSKRKGKVVQWKRKPQIIEAINELIDELDNIQQSITIQGVEHIHAKEIILTTGMSSTTFLFLKEAFKKRDFQVVVAEGAPRYDGHAMAKKLSSAGIQTTLIPDSAVFAMMARANKVLVGAHSVLANGGVVAPVGAMQVALAARHHSVPLVVLVGLHKLSPLFPNDPDLTYNDFRSPADVTDMEMLAEAFSSVNRGLPASGVLFHTASPGSMDRTMPSGADTLAPTVHVPSPEFDYVPPHHVSLFVTDLGGYTPSYVYRLLAEFYNRSDYLLSKELSGDGMA